MNFGEWMMLSISAEEEFQIEAQCRDLASAADTGKIAASLYRQTCYQQRLLQAAVHEIARLEALLPMG